MVPAKRQICEVMFQDTRPMTQLTGESQQLSPLTGSLGELRNIAGVPPALSLPTMHHVGDSIQCSRMH